MSEQFRFLVRVVGTLACGVQLYVWGPSLGLALTHGAIIGAIWFIRDIKP